MEESTEKQTQRTGSRRGAQKNGIVELLRFLFTSIIIFFHINLDLWDQQKVVTVIHGIPVTFFRHGNIGVEFFFLVTGWLMAATVVKRQDTCLRGAVNLVRETIEFVSHKARAVLPYYLTACALTPLMRLATDRTVTADYFLRRLPSLLFLQRMGIGKPFIGCTWYLSSMLLALAAAYPLCRRFYKAFTHVAAPLLGMSLLCLIIVCTGSLGDINDWFFFTYKTNIRAFAEISLGAVSYECSRRMQGRARSAWNRILLTAAASVCLLLSIAYMCSGLEAGYGLAVFCLLFIAVTIIFSGEGALCRTGVFCHPVFARLGAVSLPMYVTQTLFRQSIPCFFPKASQWTQCLLIYLGILLFADLLHRVVLLAKSRGRHAGGRLFPAAAAWRGRLQIPKLRSFQAHRFQ